MNTVEDVIMTEEELKDAFRNAFYDTIERQINFVLDNGFVDSNSRRSNLALNIIKKRKKKIITKNGRWPWKWRRIRA